MGTLNSLPAGKRVCIPCRYNGGRLVTVRATLGFPEIVHISIDTRASYGCFPYSYLTDGYLHIRYEEIERNLSGGTSCPEFFRQEAEQQIEMIREINKHYFAGRLTVLSDDTEIAEKTMRRERSFLQMLGAVVAAWKNYTDLLDFDWLLSQPLPQWSWFHRAGARSRYALRQVRKQYDRIAVVQPLSDAHLGGTWQRYYDDRFTWLAEAESLKGSRIYLAS